MLVPTTTYRSRRLSASQFYKVMPRYKSHFGYSAAQLFKSFGGQGAPSCPTYSHTKSYAVLVLHLGQSCRAIGQTNPLESCSILMQCYSFVKVRQTSPQVIDGDPPIAYAFVRMVLQGADLGRLFPWRESLLLFDCSISLLSTPLKFSFNCYLGFQVVGGQRHFALP